MNEFAGRAPVRALSRSGPVEAGHPECLARLRLAMKDFPEAPPHVLLGRAGCLHPEASGAPARLLRQTASIDLSLARLLEGHVNALSLIRVWGDEALQSACLRAAEEGHLFGVWGADDDQPVEVAGERLAGAKRYASGLGSVSRAIVSARAPEGQRLFVVKTDDPARQDLRVWRMAGMQDSASGRFDCAGLVGRPLGGPGIYTREPHFVGGTWRIAAVSLGAIQGLLDRAATALRARGHLDSDAQLLRLAPVAGRVVAAWPAILRAAAVATGPAGAADPERAATLSVAMRLLTEDLGQDAIAAAERSVGLAMFAADDPVGRAARDLACYLRQAGRDAFSLRTGRAFLGGPSLGDWLDG